ncbi:hypothetical protein AYX19_21065 (plasmid) [Paenarthrobacter ureafaciens]|nr:hypothetical protein AYX19_21065 [Paenarthrobacter ureafaciens]
MLISMAVVGKWSDKIQRRKPFVFWTSVLLAASMVIPLVSPTVPGLIAQSVVAGFAFGAYLVVDQALFIDVIVDKRNAGRDLGMSALAETLVRPLVLFLQACWSPRPVATESCGSWPSRSCWSPRPRSCQ